MENQFWEHLQQLVHTSRIVIDRPQQSVHPRYPDLIYPLDYGYLDGTTSGDGDGIDVWVGSQTGAKQVVAVLVTVDVFKRDTELKLLLNCTETEINIVVQFYTESNMGHYLLRRFD